MFNLCQRWFNLIGGATGINWQLVWIEDEFQSGQNFRILNILSVRSRDDMDVNNNGNIPIQHDQHLCSLLTAACHRMLLTKYGFESRMHESKTLKSWTKTSLGPWTVSQRPGLYILLQDHEAGDNGLPPWLMGILSRSGKQWWKVHEGTVSGDNVHSHWFLAISCFWCAFFLVCTKYIQILWHTMTQMMKSTTAPQSVAQRKLATAIRSRGDQPQWRRHIHFCLPDDTCHKFTDLDFF